MTHYDTLEVSQRASKETIKAAYKSLMQRYHPDRNPGNAEVEELARRINEAYRILSNVEARAAYDLLLATKPLQDFTTTKRPANRADWRSNEPSVGEGKKESSTLYIWVITGLLLAVLVLVSIEGGRQPGAPGLL